jgi:hypothetical protein
MGKLAVRRGHRPYEEVPAETSLPLTCLKRRDPHPQYCRYTRGSFSSSSSAKRASTRRFSRTCHQSATSPSHTATSPGFFCVRNGDSTTKHSWLSRPVGRHGIAFLNWRSSRMSIPSISFSARIP